MCCKAKGRCQPQFWDSLIECFFKRGVTFCFPDWSRCLSCSHRKILMSSLAVEERLLSCHFPRSSEVIAENIISVLCTTADRIQKLLGKKEKRVICIKSICIHSSGIMSSIFSYLSSVENSFWLRSNFPSKKSFKTSVYDLLQRWDEIQWKSDEARIES